MKSKWNANLVEINALLEEHERRDAGLVYVPKIVEGHHLYYGVTETIKQPKRLHKEKIAERQRRQLERAITYRFWKQRLNRKG